MPAYFSSSVRSFIKTPIDSIVGRLTSCAGKGFFQQLHTQTLAWIEEIKGLQYLFSGINNHAKNWHLLLEYPIPRRAKRIDAVILMRDKIVVLEYKIGADIFLKNDEDQVEDYCLDLRDFHVESKGINIYPILVCTSANQVSNTLENYSDPVKPVLRSNQEELSNLLIQIDHLPIQNHIIDPIIWDQSAYHPTPTIIEAAQTLYAEQNVRDILRFHAGAENLSTTTNAVINAVKKGKEEFKKVICFITGVPGSGKTLAGLNIVHNKGLQDSGKDLGIFLSGNGPLVKVLREALARDHNMRTNVKLTESRRKVSTFITNVHVFLDDYFYDKTRIPPDKLIIFDEAQRAWNAAHSYRKFKRNHSEAEMMLEIMDRHNDWAVIVALIGSGQEINSGEAGLREWGQTIEKGFQHWNVHVSPELLKTTDANFKSQVLFEHIPEKVHICTNDELHLKVSIRAYKADLLSKWVDLLLNGNCSEAGNLFSSELKDYPIVMTRNLNMAKMWLREKTRGTRRAGIIASSGARRLRPYGLDVTNRLQVEQWFLNPIVDIRSSNFLELPATEFDIQGLELDWSCVCWGGDFRRWKSIWQYFSLKGTSWQNVQQEDRKVYITNKYRVLLTRAREGFVIWVPPGSERDSTRLPELYDSTWKYLKSCGIVIL